MSIAGEPSFRESVDMMFKRATALMDLGPGLEEKIRVCNSTYTVRFGVRLRGKIETFVGYRSVHSEHMAPVKGGIKRRVPVADQKQGGLAKRRHRGFGLRNIGIGPIGLGSCRRYPLATALPVPNGPRADTGRGGGRPGRLHRGKKRRGCHPNSAANRVMAASIRPASVPRTTRLVP